MPVKVKGEGSIIPLEKDKPRSKCRRWQIVVPVGRDLATGKYKPRYRNVNGTYSEAQKARREFIAEIERGSIQLNDDIEFGEYSERWLEKRKKTKAIRTYETERNHVANANLHIKHAKMTEITFEVLESMYDALRDGESVSGRPLSGTYVSDIAVTLYAIFKSAMKDKLISANPCDLADHPVRDTEEKRAMHIEGINDLLSKLDPRYPVQFAIRTLVRTGMRRGEIDALRVMDVDKLEKLILVPHGTNPDGSLKDTKTESGNRVLPLTPPVEEDIDARIAHMEKLFRRNGRKLGISSLKVTGETRLVSNGLGEPLKPEAITHWWTRNRTELGFDGWTLHELRHSYLTEMARRKVDPKVLQKLAGHASYRTTEDIYIHVAFEEQKRAVEEAGWW